MINIIIDLNARAVRVNGNLVRLTKTEFAILPPSPAAPEPSSAARTSWPKCGGTAANHPPARWTSISARCAQS